MKSKTLGLLIGVAVGAICRPAFIYAFFLAGQKSLTVPTVLAVVLTSSLIGALIGLLASYLAISRGLLQGAAIGAATAYGVSYVSFCFLCIAIYDPRGGSSQEWINPDLAIVLMHFLVLATGAIPGVLGGLVGI